MSEFDLASIETRAAPGMIDPPPGAIWPPGIGANPGMALEPAGPDCDVSETSRCVALGGPPAAELKPGEGGGTDEPSGPPDPPWGPPTPPRAADAPRGAESLGPDPRCSIARKVLRTSWASAYL